MLLPQKSFVYIMSAILIISEMKVEKNLTFIMYQFT